MKKQSSSRFRVSVSDCYSRGETKHYEGTRDEICEALIAAYPWLSANDERLDRDFRRVTEYLGVAQAFSVSVKRLTPSASRKRARRAATRPTK